MIKPTVGRVVWYYSVNRLPNEQPWAAIVAHVHGDRLVNLMVVSPSGSSLPHTAVTLVQEEDEIPVNTAYCSWMPYQIGQAKKHVSDTLTDMARKGFGEGAVG